MKALSAAHRFLACRIGDDGLPAFERIAAGYAAGFVFRLHGLLFCVVYAAQDRQINRLRAKIGRA